MIVSDLLWLHEKPGSAQSSDLSTEQSHAVLLNTAGKMLSSSDLVSLEVMESPSAADLQEQ